MRHLLTEFDTHKRCEIMGFQTGTRYFMFYSCFYKYYTYSIYCNECIKL